MQINNMRYYKNNTHFNDLAKDRARQTDLETAYWNMCSMVMLRDDDDHDDDYDYYDIKANTW